MNATHLNLNSLLLLALLIVVGCNQSDEKKNQSSGKEKEQQGGAFRIVKEEPKSEYSLDEEQTAYLWDMEHHANILGKHGFSPLIAAIIENDRERVLNSVGEPVGTILAGEVKTLTYKSDVLDLRRDTVDGTVDSNTVTTEKLIDFLMEKRELFKSSPPPKANFYVRSILPPDKDEYWYIQCIHRIWGESKDGGPLEVNIHMNLKTYEIDKSRMDLGSWLFRCDITQVDHLRSTKPLFAATDPKRTSIFPDTFHDNWQSPRKEINTGGAYACDYNRDGFTDLFITDLREDAGKMFTGRKDGRFVDETYFLGLETLKNARIAAFVDLDNDGWEDIFVPDQPRIFRNLKGEKFVNYTGATNLPLMLDLTEGERKRISAVVPADFDLDGDLDLYITRSVENVGSWLESEQPQLAHNQLLRNDGNWTFTDITNRTKTNGEGRSTFSAVWADVNNDRYPDLYIINEFGNGSLLLNKNGKTFERLKLTPDQNDFGSMGLTCGDYNNDGNIDIYVSNMYSKAGSRVMGNMKDGTYPEEVQARLRSMVAGGELYQNNGDLSFKPVGKGFQIHAAGWAWGSSLADLNNDGWLDLYVTAGFISRDRKKPDG